MDIHHRPQKIQPETEIEYINLISMQHTLIIQALFSLKHNNHHESNTNTFIHQFSNQEISQHTQPFYVIQISK